MIPKITKIQKNIVQRDAYAKINTYLEVLERRPDGYHELCSHMQLITLHDTLSLAVKSEEAEAFALQLSLTCDRPDIPLGEGNLICRAARAYFSAVEMPRCILRLEFHLCKNIPMQGGLAGGSADAAAALLMINEACGNALSEDALCNIGAALGADIPFCIRGLQGAQTARGIGEVMTPAPGICPDMTLLVVLPGTTVSTPAAFALLDDRYGSAESRERAVQNERRYEAHIKALLSGDPTTFAKTSFNRFEEAVFSLQPQTKEVFDRVVALGADMVRMSGSGPTIVAAFADADAASRAEKVLLEQGYMAHRCHTLPATQNL